jgi:hypothetical protein
MARPQVADRDSLQVWRVAANILNKQSRTADMGGRPVWGLAQDRDRWRALVNMVMNLRVLTPRSYIVS